MAFKSTPAGNADVDVQMTGRVPQHVVWTAIESGHIPVPRALTLPALTKHCRATETLGSLQLKIDNTDERLCCI